MCSSLLLADIASANASAKSVSVVGDVNGDGKINVTDVGMVIDHILEHTSANFVKAAADVNGDGEVNVTDVGLLIDIILSDEAVDLGEGTEVSLDTIKIIYQNDKVNIDGSYDKNILKATVKGTKVKIVSSGKRPFVCLAEGECSNGSLSIDADTTCTLTLNNLQLTSQESAAISFSKKQKVNIELPKGSQNFLSDASSRAKGDDTKACLYSKGTMTFTGKGSLSVSGNYSHAIASSKNISVEGGHLAIDNVVKNGIHCDKFTLKKGQIDLHLQNDVSKGIKAKEELNIKGGSIEGEASGGITIEDGDLSYCALLKCDSCMTVSDGTITLTHSGDGGRCISVDKNLTITGGTFTLECDGDGGKYINEDDEEDYYTPKCITADDSVFIHSGAITCLSIGLGGKGIVAGKYLSIGNEQKDEKDEVPDIRVETRGTCIYDDIDEDLRFGCPKGIKANERINIYDGNILVNTEGQGGEGIECNNEMYIYRGSLECNTYDDGINVGKSIEISGGQVYCNSVNNDGIDSNGSITISGGIVASVNQSRPNESFDSEGGQLYLLGGTVFGIGSNPVTVKESAYPCYSTPYDKYSESPWGRGLILSEGKYIYVKSGDKAFMALRNDNNEFRSFITIMSTSFTEKGQYTISEGDCPTDYKQILWNKLYIDCFPNSEYPITEIIVKTK